MLLRLLTLVTAQSLDLGTFALMIRRLGPGAEANPIVSQLFEALGMPAVALAKLALVVCIGALVVAGIDRGGRGRWSAVAGVPLALAIAAGLIGGITNTATILA